jgi:hypothetical protein
MAKPENERCKRARESEEGSYDGGCNQEGVLKTEKKKGLLYFPGYDRWST